MTAAELDAIIFTALALPFVVAGFAAVLWFFCQPLEIGLTCRGGLNCESAGGLRLRFFPLGVEFELEDLTAPRAGWAVSIFGYTIWRERGRRLRNWKRNKNEQPASAADCQVMDEDNCRSGRSPKPKKPSVVSRRSATWALRIWRFFDRHWGLWALWTVVSSCARLFELRQMRASVTYGSSNPARLGQVVGYYSAFSPLLPAHADVELHPDWRPSARLEFTGEVEVAFRPWHLLSRAIWMGFRTFRRNRFFKQRIATRV